MMLLTVLVWLYPRVWFRLHAISTGAEDMHIAAFVLCMFTSSLHWIIYCSAGVHVAAVKFEESAVMESAEP